MRICSIAIVVLSGIILQTETADIATMNKDLKVLVSSNDYPEAGLEILRQHFTVFQSQYTHFGAEGITENKEELLRLSPGISGLVWVSHHPITKELLDKAGTKKDYNFKSLKEVLKAKEISTKQKFKIFNSCIIPVITYGCQTWGLTKKQQNKLKVVQNNMERSVLNIKLRDRVKISKIKSMSKTKPITKIIEEQKWRWTGHMIREHLEKWTRDVVEWCPRFNKRQRGRQRVRWSEDIEKVCGGAWMTTARQREKWKVLEEAYVKEDE